MVKDCITKRNIVTVVIFFPDVESGYGESDSDSGYFEEPLKNSKGIKKRKIDYVNTSDVKKPN